MIAANAAGGDDDRLGLERKLAGCDARTLGPARKTARLQDLAAHAVDGAAACSKPAHAMAKTQVDEPTLGAFPDTLDEWREDAVSGAPGDVEAWHRVAV